MATSKSIIRNTQNLDVGSNEYATKYSVNRILNRLLENDNLLATLSQIGYRTFGEMSRVTTYFLPSMTIFFTTLLFGITLFTIPLVASPKISWKPFHWKEWKENISLLLIGLLPIAWCTVLLNHSILHILFTYRNMLPVLIVILLLLLEHVEIKRKKAEKKT